ncbi:hypothetical protein D3C80_1863230 [compost metagenome]
MKEKIKQLKIEQEKLIKQHETVQKLFNTDDEVEDADTDIEILEIEEEPATPSTPKQKVWTYFTLRVKFSLLTISKECWLV